MKVTSGLMRSTRFDEPEGRQAIIWRPLFFQKATRVVPSPELNVLDSVRPLLGTGGLVGCRVVLAVFRRMSLHIRLDVSVDHSSEHMLASAFVSWDVNFSVIHLSSFVKK